VSKQLDVGVVIGDTAYRHLDNYSTRVFIAVWTGVMTHIDDCYDVYADGVVEFSTRLMRQERQVYPILDTLAEMSKEFADHWSTLGADMILAGELDFLSSLRIDVCIKDMKVSFGHFTNCFHI
jgi:hypothetical protein